MLRRWRDLLASLGDSLVDVAEAEVAALKQDLRVSGRRLAAAIVLGVVAAALIFWAIGAACFLLYQVLVLWLPGWGAALAVLSFLVIVALISGLIARQRLRDLEAPMDTVRRRVDDHKEWWQSNLLAQEDQDDPAELTDRDSPGRLDA